MLDGGAGGGRDQIAGVGIETGAEIERDASAAGGFRCHGDSHGVGVRLSHLAHDLALWHLLGGFDDVEQLGDAAWIATKRGAEWDFNLPLFVGDVFVKAEESVGFGRGEVPAAGPEPGGDAAR